MDINVNLKIEAKEIMEALKEIATCLKPENAMLVPAAKTCVCLKSESAPSVITNKTTDKKAANRKPKEEKPAPKTIEKAHETSEIKETQELPESKEEPKIDEAELRAKIKSESVAMTREGKSAGVKKLLADYDVKKLSELAADKLEEFLAAVRNL